MKSMENLRVKVTIVMIVVQDDECESESEKENSNSEDMSSDSDCEVPLGVPRDAEGGGVGEEPAEVGGEAEAEQVDLRGKAWKTCISGPSLLEVHIQFMNNIQCHVPIVNNYIILPFINS